MDILESALEKFHFSSTLYCAYCTNRAPWGIGLGASRSVQFHAVRSGRAWIQVRGGETVALRAGDFVVLPHGDAHDVVDAADTPAIPAPELLASIPRTNRWVVDLGKDGALSELICAGFACLPGSRNPLLSFLPRSIHLRAAETASLEPILVLAEREMRAPGRATAAILARAAEILLVESVRIYVKVLRPGQGGWLAALNDPRLAEVMQAIHHDPSRRWTIMELAAKGAMSRSSLAARFRTLVGTPVQAYIARFRMITAATLLEDPRRPSLARVAEKVGYGSEAAFCRAFIREMGVAPSTLRPASNGKRAGRSA